MNSDNCNVIPGYKHCAGKDCSEQGIYRLKILFINKCGWFCDSCKDTLVSNGLADEASKESE